jgi:hypothetical protein
MRDAQLQAMSEAVELLKPGGGPDTASTGEIAPSARAAAIVRDLIERHAGTARPGPETPGEAAAAQSSI